MWRDVKKIIHHNHHFILTTHEHPDGDGIGSACALIELLKTMGKQARFIVDSPIAERFSFLDYHSRFSLYNPQMDLSDAQVLILLDTHRLERIGRLRRLLPRLGLTSVCIDHHLPTSTFTPYTLIDTRACSTGAMIYTLYKEMGFPLSLEAANGIYTSVISDTGRFSYASTSRKAHKLADECIKIGVDPQVMHRRLFQQTPLESIPLFIAALKSVEFFFDNQLMIQSIWRSDYETQDIDLHDLDYLLEFDKTLKGLICIALLRELRDGKVRISLRASSDNINVEPAMKQMGGGGHSKAAGATVAGGLMEAKKQLVDLLKEYFPKPDV